MEIKNQILDSNSQILVTGAGGFIGKRVVLSLLENGFTKIRCLARPSTDPDRMYKALGVEQNDHRIEIFEGNLLSPEDCAQVSKNTNVVFHLAAGRGLKSYPDAYLNSVVTTRNLLDQSIRAGFLKRFVNVSSFAVYTNRYKTNNRILDETCPVEKQPLFRGDAYCFAKIKQEELLNEYSTKYSIPYVIIRPGVVYGPGNEGIHARVGLDTFGIFLHLGGANTLPLTYVDNCAEAIVLSGLVGGVESEVFNVVDDDLPSSREFLHLYKKHVKNFPSLYIPKSISLVLSYGWEKYFYWSKGQLPNSFNIRDWYATWKKTNYTNSKIKQLLGWRQKVSTHDALNIYFKICRERLKDA
ncbi:MAG: NAD(P)-dependent oxidoreductase [Calditrichaceae bacterium]|nr:NAD(P)-dependent oxidoreductase [Calditrichia bacterium]NUQ43372.1 NAD(P)-dependent oxidoreductase [Calditrichaceae bacterium]